jgi:hypothetical protein
VEEVEAPAAADGGGDDDRIRPTLELVQVELERVFEDMDEFNIDDFMEGDAVSSYIKADIEDALKALAAKQPAPVIIDEGEQPPYKKPRVM